MIRNPSDHVLAAAITAEARADESDVVTTPNGRNHLGVRRYKSTDYDAEFDKLVRVIETRITNVDAKLMERQRNGGYKLVHYPSLQKFMESAAIKTRIREHLSASNVKGIADRLRQYTEDDPAYRQLRESQDRVLKGEGRRRKLREQAGTSFALGMYADEMSATGTSTPTVFALQDTILPSTSSPMSKQQLFMDYQESHRKCLAGDVRVRLLDGSTPTMQELAARGEGAEFWVYACKDGLVYPAQARSPRQTGVMHTFEVELDNGEVVRATASHPFMTRDGQYRCVDELKPGDSLMPLYRKERMIGGGCKNVYGQVRHPELDLWEYTHHLVARVTQRDKFVHGTWDHVDHINETPSDNRPENLALLTHSAHMVKTAAHPARRAFAVALGKRERTPEDNAHMSVRQKAAWADPKVRAARIAGLQRAWANPEKQARMRAGLKSSPNHLKAANHKVVSIRSAGVEPVYDITVPGFSNFALAAGVFVHNSWEAATRNPIGVRIVNIIGQFVLGRGVEGSIESMPHQEAWDDFVRVNKLRSRLRQYLKELLIYGEVFYRYFKRPEGLIVRSLDPSTIWDIMTDPEDIEDVKFYHQQFTILNTSPVPYIHNTPSTLIIRQIPGNEIDHYKINATSSEKRGRSQLYCILGWLLRFKEFANDRVLLNKMRAMFALDVSVDGDATDVALAEAQFSTPPGPGAVLVHNKAVTVAYKNANNNANEAKTDAEMILKVIAVGAGVSEQFLGVSGASTRAGALIQTEPDVKNFETYQEIVEDMLHDAWRRVRAYKRGLGQTTARMAFTFPALAQEDRSAKLKDLAFAEAMDWIKKERAGSMAAREFNISTYDFAEEQTAIAAERKDVLSPVMAQGMQQVPKIAPDPEATPGLGEDLKPVGGTAQPSNRKVTQTSGEMGFSAQRLSGRGQANTRATLNRSGFTRGGEKLAIKNRRTSGTPLRAAAGAARPKHVWSDAARDKALRVRREKRLATLEAQYATETNLKVLDLIQPRIAALRESLKKP